MVVHDVHPATSVKVRLRIIGADEGEEELVIGQGESAILVEVEVG